MSYVFVAPWGRAGAKVAGFIRNANTAGEATAERSADLEASFEKFPAALQALRRQMVQLKRFSDQARPTFADLAQAAPNITRSTEALGPFAKAATPALTTLGTAAQQSIQPIVKSDPTLVKIRNLAREAPGGARALSKLLSTLRKSGGNEELMKLIYFTNGGINGFDKFGHFLRADLQITPSCTTLNPLPGNLGCKANWGQVLGKVQAAKQAATVPSPTSGAVPSPEATGVPFDAAGNLAGAAGSPSQAKSRPKPHAPSLDAARHLLDTIIGRQGHIKDTGGPSEQYTTPNGQGGTAP
jgi:hypothetical protein